MKAMKRIKKTVAPDILVNCIECETSTDVYNAFTDAKIRASKPISADEFEIAKNTAVAEHEEPVVAVVVKMDVIEKKKPWYKRFWNWLTGRK